MVERHQFHMVQHNTKQFGKLIFVSKTTGKNPAFPIGKATLTKR